MCVLCQKGISSVKAQETDLLRSFLTRQANIKPKKYTHLCAKHQRLVAKAIKQARQLGLLPFVKE